MMCYISHRLNIDVSEARQSWHSTNAQQHSKRISSNAAAGTSKVDAANSSDTDADDTIEQALSTASSVASSRKTSTANRQRSFKRSRSMQRALERR